MPAEGSPSSSLDKDENVPPDAVDPGPSDSLGLDMEPGPGQFGQLTRQPLPHPAQPAVLPALLQLGRYLLRHLLPGLHQVCNTEGIVDKIFLISFTSAVLREAPRQGVFR